MSGPVGRVSLAALARATQNTEMTQNFERINAIQDKCNKIAKSTLEHVTPSNVHSNEIKERVGELRANIAASSNENINVDQEISNSLVRDTLEFNTFEGVFAFTQDGETHKANIATRSNENISIDYKNIELGIKDAIRFNKFDKIFTYERDGKAYNAKQVVDPRTMNQNRNAPLEIRIGSEAYRVGDADTLNAIAESEVHYFDENSNPIEAPQGEVVDVVATDEFMKELHFLIHDRLLANQTEKEVPEANNFSKRSPITNRNEKPAVENQGSVIEDIKKRFKDSHEYNRHLSKTLSHGEDRERESQRTDNKRVQNLDRNRAAKKNALEKQNLISRERKSI
jgi:hypothetical protein